MIFKDLDLYTVRKEILEEELKKEKEDETWKTIIK